MKFRNNRTFWANEKKAKDVFRILCIGDSMTYGHGVNFDETLPCYLEMFLNRAIWNLYVEVINEGVCGHSIYDEWNQFVQRGVRFHPDLLLIILCDNDVELFSVADSYAQHIQECWDEDGMHLSYFRKFVIDIKSITSELGLPVVVGFYHIYNDDLAPRASSIIGAACAGNGIDYVDMSVDFRSGVPMWLNDLDGHPGAQAHSIAAGKLARFLISRDYLKNGKELLKEEMVYKSLMEKCGEIINCGYKPEIALHLTLNIMKAKRMSNNRLKMHEGDLIGEKDFCEMLSNMENLRNIYVSLLYWEAYGVLLERYGSRFCHYLLKINGLIQSVLKDLCIMEKNLDDPALEYFPRSDKPLDELMGCPSVQQLDIKLDVWLGLLDKARDVYSRSALQCQRSERSDVLENGIWCRLARFNGSIQDCWDECERVLHACKFICQRNSSIQKKINNRPDDIARISAVMKKIDCELTDIFDILNSIIELIKPDMVCEPFSVSQGPFVVIKVGLTFKCPEAKEAFMYVHLYSLVPDYPFVQDSRYIYNDAQLHYYSMKFPLFFLGKIGINFSALKGVKPSADMVHIEDITVSCDEKWTVTVKGDEMCFTGTGTCLSVTPLIWFPQMAIPDIIANIEVPFGSPTSI